MAKMKFQTHYSGDEFARQPEKPGISQTVPGQSMTPNEVIKRFTQGLSVGAFEQTAYGDQSADDSALDDELKFKDWSKMDLAELEELRYEVAARIDEIQTDYKEKKREFDMFRAKEEQDAWKAHEERIEKRVRDEFARSQQQKEQ